MKTLKLFTAIVFLFLVSPEPAQAQGEWYLSYVIGTSEDAYTSVTNQAQLFNLRGYIYDGMPPLLCEAFVKSLPLYNLPKKISAEFLVESFSNLDSMEIYLGLEDSAKTNLGADFNQRYLVNLNQTNVWVKVEFEIVDCRFNTIDGIKFMFNLYTQKGVLTSCRMLMRNVIGIINDDSSFAIDPSIMTGVNDKTQIPKGFVLEQNYPNPFNPTTMIRYDISKYSSVNLTIYDMLGRRVAELVNQSQSAGIYEVPFNGSNLASGTYIYILRTENFILEKKMILLK